LGDEATELQAALRHAAATQVSQSPSPDQLPEFEALVSVIDELMDLYGWIEAFLLDPNTRDADRAFVTRALSTAYRLHAIKGIKRNLPLLTCLDGNARAVEKAAFQIVSQRWVR
jgi:hypothetical protein